MSNVYFLEADDHTAPAVSCEGKNTILVLARLKLKSCCCNLGREEKEVIGYFLFVDMIIQSLFIYSIYICICYCNDENHFNTSF